MNPERGNLYHTDITMYKFHSLSHFTFPHTSIGSFGKFRCNSPKVFY